MPEGYSWSMRYRSDPEAVKAAREKLVKYMFPKSRGLSDVIAGVLYEFGVKPHEYFGPHMDAASQREGFRDYADEVDSKYKRASAKHVGRIDKHYEGRVQELLDKGKPVVDAEVQDLKKEWTKKRFEADERLWRTRFGMISHANKAVEKNIATGSVPLIPGEKFYSIDQVPKERLKDLKPHEPIAPKVASPPPSAPPPVTPPVAPPAPEPTPTKLESKLDDVAEKLKGNLAGAGPKEESFVKQALNLTKQHWKPLAGIGAAIGVGTLARQAYLNAHKKGKTTVRQYEEVLNSCMFGPPSPSLLGGKGVGAVGGATGALSQMKPKAITGPLHNSSGAGMKSTVQAMGKAEKETMNNMGNLQNDPLKGLPQPALFSEHTKQYLVVLSEIMFADRYAGMLENLPKMSIGEHWDNFKSAASEAWTGKEARAREARVDSSLGKGFSKDFNKMWDDYTSPKSTAQRAGASGMTHIGETMGRGGGVPTVGAQIGEGLSNSKSMAGGAMKQVGSAFKPKETGPSLAGRAGGSESFGLFSGKNAPVSPSLTGGGMKATASAGGPSLLGGKFGKVKI